MADQSTQDWVDNLQPADIELAIHAAMTARDVPAVVAFMRLLAIKDPHRAAELLNVVQVGMSLAKERSA